MTTRGIITITVSILLFILIVVIVGENLAEKEMENKIKERIIKYLASGKKGNLNFNFCFTVKEYKIFQRVVYRVINQYEELNDVEIEFNIERGLK